MNSKKAENETREKKIRFVRLRSGQSLKALGRLKKWYLRGKNLEFFEPGLNLNNLRIYGIFFLSNRIERISNEFQFDYTPSLYHKWLPFIWVKSNKTDEKVCVETEQLCNYIYPHITDNVVWCGAGSLYHCNLQFTFDQKSSWVAVSKNYQVWRRWWTCFIISLLLTQFVISFAFLFSFLLSYH